MSFEDLLERNAKWSAETAKTDPDLLASMGKGQSPEILWIGCSDSRVPPDTILNTKPGTIFAHRNIANVVSPTDLSILSILQFGLEALKIRQIVVCGHYACGGVIASMDEAPHGLVDNWLNHIRTVSRLHQSELNAIADKGARASRLSELNVLAQVDNVAATTVVQDLWRARFEIDIHGVIFDVKSGKLTHLTTRGPQ